MIVAVVSVILTFLKSIFLCSRKKYIYCAAVLYHLSYEDPYTIFFCSSGSFY